MSALLIAHESVSTTERPDVVWAKFLGTVEMFSSRRTRSLMVDLMPRAPHAATVPEKSRLTRE